MPDCLGLLLVVAVTAVNTEGREAVVGGFGQSVDEFFACDDSPVQLDLTGLQGRSHTGRLLPQGLPPLAGRRIPASSNPSIDAIAHPSTNKRKQNAGCLPHLTGANFKAIDTYPDRNHA